MSHSCIYNPREYLKYKLVDRGQTTLVPLKKVEELAELAWKHDENFRMS